MAEYSDYSDIFSTKIAIELLENTGMNKHIIELKKSKQSLFKSIYSLGPVKLETLKTYIKTNLANNFIQLFKSPARALILFDKKSDESLRLYIEYWALNNIISKTNICYL